MRILHISRRNLRDGRLLGGLGDRIKILYLSRACVWLAPSQKLCGCVRWQNGACPNLPQYCKICSTAGEQYCEVNSTARQQYCTFNSTVEGQGITTFGKRLLHTIAKSITSLHTPKISAYSTARATALPIEEILTGLEGKRASYIYKCQLKAQERHRPQGQPGS